MINIGFVFALILTYLSSIIECELLYVFNSIPFPQEIMTPEIVSDHGFYVQREDPLKRYPS